MKTRILRRALPVVATICLATTATNAFAAGDPKVSDAVPVLMAAGALGTSYFSGDMEGSWQLIEGMTTTVAATYALKYTVDKKRPDGSDNHSFPSSHSSVAFAAAGFIGWRYGWQYGAPMAVLATYVATSRVDLHKHDNVDVIAGGLLGLGTTWWFTTPKSKVSVTPEAGLGYTGIRVSTRW